MLSLFSTNVSPNIKNTPGELLRAFYPSLELSRVLIRLYPARAYCRLSSFHSMLMKFYFDGMKKLRILLMNLVFFMTSSSLCGVRRFPSRISLMMSLKIFQIIIRDLPVPSPVVFLLEDTALFHLEVELLIIDFGIVVGL